MQAIVDKTILARFEPVDFEIRPRQILSDIVSSSRYLKKETKALLNIDEFLE